MVLKQLFFQKIMKNRLAARGFAPRPPSIIRLNYITLLCSTRLPIQTFSHFNYWFKPSPVNEFLVTCQHHATVSDLPFYDIFATHKNSSVEVSDHVIACDLWFEPPPTKNSGYANACHFAYLAKYEVGLESFFTFRTCHFADIQLEFSILHICNTKKSLKHIFLKVYVWRSIKSWSRVILFYGWEQTIQRFATINIVW